MGSPSSSPAHQAISDQTGSSAAAALSAPAPRPARYGFIDLLRGFALVVMIETHTVNAYLPAGARHAATFFWLTFFNGLVAPAFLFASGFSIMLQASRQWDGWLHFRLPFWKQMRRLGFIILVAYYSHIDDFKFSKYLHPDNPGLWRTALQVDILQCIVVSLLVVHILVFLLRRRSRVACAAGLLAVAVAITTPWMWSQNFSDRLPMSLALYLNPHGISLFPLFPWAFFVFAGSCASHLFLNSVEKGRQNRYMRAILVAGVLMIVGSLAARAVPFTLPGRQGFYTTSPLYVVLRAGCVLILCALLYFLERSARWIPRRVQLAGQESLMVYGVHLWVIFALLRGKHVGPSLGLEMGYAGCLVLSAAIVVFMLWLAKHWHNLKRTHPRLTKLGQAATVLTLVLVFLSR